MRKQRLELTWIGKDERPRVEPRILLEDVEKSYHATIKREGDIFDNRLIFGDNLLALKALEEEFLGKVKCVYIDPPFNTKQALDHYEDGLEHSIWLTLIKDRLEIRASCKIHRPSDFPAAGRGIAVTVGQAGAGLKASRRNI
jgi:adenine-specific DNA-methyltransferase